MDWVLGIVLHISVSLSVSVLDVQLQYQLQYIREESISLSRFIDMPGNTSSDEDRELLMVHCRGVW